MKQKILEAARKWKHFWMNQTQNSKEDFKNYYNRAFGVDSNMIHHLSDVMAELIAKDYVPMEQVRSVLFLLQRGGCWCEVGIGNPMMTSHSKGCLEARELADQINAAILRASDLQAESKPSS